MSRVVEHGWMRSVASSFFAKPAPVVKADRREVLLAAAEHGAAMAQDKTLTTALVETCLCLAPLHGLPHRDERRFGMLRMGEFEIFVREDAPSEHSLMIRYEGHLVFGCAPNTVHHSEPGTWCRELLALERP